MIKWLLCKLVGFACVWESLQERVHVRDSYGVHVNVEPHKVQELIVVQRCTTCGKYRSCTVAR